MGGDNTKPLAEFPTGNGDVILVEVEDLEAVGGTTRRGLPSSAVVERAQTSFEDALENAQPMASGLIDKLLSIAGSSDEVHPIQCSTMRQMLLGWFVGGYLAPRGGGKVNVSKVVG